MQAAPVLHLGCIRQNTLSLSRVAPERFQTRIPCDSRTSFTSFATEPCRRCIDFGRFAHFQIPERVIVVVEQRRHPRYESKHHRVQVEPIPEDALRFFRPKRGEPVVITRGDEVDLVVDQPMLKAMIVVPFGLLTVRHASEGLDMGRVAYRDDRVAKATLPNSRRHPSLSFLSSARRRSGRSHGHARHVPRDAPDRWAHLVEAQLLRQRSLSMPFRYGAAVEDRESCPCRPRRAVA